MEKEIAIKIENLTKSFGERIAVKSLSLEVYKGELFSLLGMNGAGKTTTIKMLSGLLEPTSGNAFVFGDSIVSNIDKVKQQINVSPQETAIASALTVKENLIFIAEIYGFNKEESIKRTEEMLVTFSIKDRENDRVTKLSGGLKRRLSIAMALITSPKIIFLDEPTLGLDVVARRQLWKILEKLKKNVTIILTTHYLEEAEALCDRIAIISEGELKALGTVAELKAQANEENIEEAFIKLSGVEVTE